MIWFSGALLAPRCGVHFTLACRMFLAFFTLASRLSFPCLKVASLSLHACFTINSSCFHASLPDTLYPPIPHYFHASRRLSIGLRWGMEEGGGGGGGWGFERALRNKPKLRLRIILSSLYAHCNSLHSYFTFVFLLFLSCSTLHCIPRDRF